MTGNRNILGLLLLLLLGWGVTSCSTDRKLAMGFVENPPPINFLLIPPEEIYKFSHKGEEIPDFDSLPPAVQDSLLFYNSRYIQFIDDSAFLEDYVNNFLDELRQLGMKVYLPEVMDSFLMQQPQSYVIHMAQLQLDEYNYPLEDEATFFDSTYYKYFTLNGVDFSVWYEINKMNAGKSKKTVLYSTYQMGDGFSGNFYNEPFSTSIKYKYYIDTLTVNDVYSLGIKLGRRHADYLYDFFLNQYVLYHLPGNEAPWFYYHWDRKKKKLVPVENDKFQVLSSQQ